MTVLYKTAWLLRAAIVLVTSFLAVSTAEAGLVGHWKLDEGSGDVFADSAAGNDGFLPPDVTVDWVNDGPPGIQNVSVEFSGDIGPSYIETPFEGIGGDDPRTIALWVRTEPQANHTALVAWGSLDTGRKWHFRVNRDTGTLRTEFSGGQYFSETNIEDGEWHHVASVFPEGGFEGDDIIHYVDGQLDPKMGGTSIPIDTAIDAAEGAFPVHIGWAAGHDGRWFTGQMADVRIYDEGLDQAAIQAIMMGEGLGTRLLAGDANQDLTFDQVDLVQVQIAAKYLTGEAATWGEGDWDGAPGGEPGSPPPGNGMFDQLDIVSALSAGVYLTGPYGAVKPHPEGSGNATLRYDPGTGELAVEVPGTELTSINIDSAAAIFTGEPAMNLGGSFDNDADNNLFKATFGSSFGSLSFGNVAQAGLSEEFVRNDLTVIGSLAGGGDLGDVDLIYVPEPGSALLLFAGMAGLIGFLRRSQLAR